MENVEFKLDTKEIEAYSKKIGTLHKSAYPSAVRSTLNGAAFDVKKRTLLKSAKDNFVERQPNFFKANSTVDVATGFNVDTMKATVGMSEERLKDKSTNYAVKDLEQQEHGGEIKHKTFIGARAARVGRKGVVRKQLTLDAVADKSVKSYDIRSRRSKRGNSVPVNSERERFVIAAHLAGKGGFIMTRSAILRVDSLGKNGRSRIKTSLIYTKKTGRSISVEGTHFMETAAYSSAKKMPYIYKKEAEFQFKKHLG